MSTQVFRPRAPFQEAKIYWDGKNQIYAIKKEVGVMATKPHFCLFIQKGVVRSKHDYENLKDTYRSYIPFLQKTIDEVFIIPGDERNKSWGILFDRAYIGREDDTPGLRRITPTKNASTLTEVTENQEKNKLRVPVEWFFGRLQKLWKVFREIYRWSHQNFDIDFDN